MTTLAEQIDDFTDAFDLDAAWSMAGVILIRADDGEQISLKPDGKIWSELCEAADEILTARGYPEP
jgi:hypothetical protein